MLHFAILRYLMQNCIWKYKCEYTVYILQVLVYRFVPKAFVCDINLLLNFYLLKSVKYKALPGCSTVIGKFPSKLQEK